eukprot:7252587-Ditylum_brightwellii.AAC.1
MKQQVPKASAADSIWYIFHPIINEVNSEMQLKQNITNSPDSLLNDFLTCMHQKQNQHLTGVAASDQNDDEVVDINNDGTDGDGADNNSCNNYNGKDSITNTYGDKYQGGANDNGGNNLVNIDDIFTKNATSSLEEVMNKKVGGNTEYGEEEQMLLWLF